MATTAYLLLFLCATASAKLPLPSYITPCAKSDPAFKACVQKRANETIPHVLDGDKKYKVPVYVPLKIDLLEVNQASLGITFNLKDVNIWGFREVQLGDIDIDLKNKHMKYQLFLPRVEMIMKYNVSGRVLVLPVVGNGDGNMTFLNCHIELAFDYSLDERDGDEYMIPGVNKLDINTTRIYIHLDNLFNGDKLLGQQQARARYCWMYFGGSEICASVVKRCMRSVAYQKGAVVVRGCHDNSNPPIYSREAKSAKATCRCCAEF